MQHLIKRYEKWLKRLEESHLDGFVVTHPSNLRYLFNFSGSSGAACTLGGESHLVIDSRYIEQANSESVNCQLLLAEQSLEETLQDLLSDPHKGPKGQMRMGFEGRHLTYEFARHLQSSSSGIEWVSTRHLVEELRMIKDREEVKKIRKAFGIAQQAYGNIREKIRPGMREVEIAGLLEFELRRAGGEGPAFETIAASGPRSSLPHGVASNKSLEPDELLLIDFGVKYRGYCSDLTRIEFLPRAHEPEIYSIVKEAQQRVLSLTRPGVSSAALDAAARTFISERGYGDYFKHSTGHGLGLEVHELPSISSRHPREIQEGMIFTVEPGIYLPGQYGVRIEDCVLVTKNGCQVLSEAG